AGGGAAPHRHRDHPGHAVARPEGAGAGQDAAGLCRAGGGAGGRGAGAGVGAGAHRARVRARPASGAEPAGGAHRPGGGAHGGGGGGCGGLVRGGGLAGGRRYGAAGVREPAPTLPGGAPAAGPVERITARVKTNLLNPTLGNGGGRPYGGAAPRLPRLATGDLINLSDLSRKEFLALLDLAADLKVHPGRYRDLLSGCGLAMIFEKPSLRTRVTFDVAMQEMGGHAVFLDFTESPLGEREDIVDVARNLELWMDAIVARTFEHESIELLAQASAVPVINGLSDFSHPCQALADFLTLREEFEDFDGLKLAYVGDGNNTLHSLLEAAALAGIGMGVATPAGYEPDAALVARVQQIAKRSGAQIEIGNRTAAAVKGASAVYTDTWASMGQEA